jgi:hypothetical protein
VPLDELEQHVAESGIWRIDADRVHELLDVMVHYKPRSGCGMKEARAQPDVTSRCETECSWPPPKSGSCHPVGVSAESVNVKSRSVPPICRSNAKQVLIELARTWMQAAMHSELSVDAQ